MTREMNWFGWFDPIDGYGNMGIQIVQALLQERVDVYPTGWLFGPKDDVYENKYPDWLKALVQRAFKVCDTGLVLSQPMIWSRYSQMTRLWGETMFESDQLPTGWADDINRSVRRLIVPSTWLVDVFRQSGVDVPIHVVPLGVNPMQFRHIERPADRMPYTFLWIGRGDNRKGWDVAYRAFIKEFGHDDRVRLMLKVREHHLMPNGRHLVFDDPNVVLIREDQTSLTDLLAMADCFVFPSRGEGFGLPPREAAATGLPVIATNWGGLADDIEKYALPVDVSDLVVAHYSQWGICGMYAEPDRDDVQHWMRWCFENREAAIDRGRQAGAWVRDHLTWQHTAQKTVALLSAYEWSDM